MPSTKQAGEKPALPLVFLAAEPVNREKEKASPDAAWHFYSCAIKRSPGNLSLHTHRVFFAITHKDGIFLSGALHDLFYVLKDAGEALRIRLLKASRPILDKDETAYFAKWIKTDAKKKMEYRWVAGSVLAEGLVGADQDLITIEKSAASTASLSPLEEAQSCIEYGQLEMAQSILQDALNSSDQANNKTVLQKELDNLQHYLKKNKKKQLATTL